MKQGSAADVDVMEGERTVSIEAPRCKRTEPPSAVEMSATAKSAEMSTTEMHAAKMSTAAEMSTAKMHAAAVPAAAEMSPKTRPAKVSTPVGTGVGSRRQNRRQTDDSNSDFEFRHDSFPPSLGR